MVEEQGKRTKGRIKNDGRGCGKEKRKGKRSRKKRKQGNRKGKIRKDRKIGKGGEWGRGSGGRKEKRGR